MIKIDLITGFLGSGKTTFIRKYVKHLTDKGLKIGILENDYGAVNVDAMLLQDILGDKCELEMVAGGCDADCHKRRFKTKLIAPITPIIIIFSILLLFHYNIFNHSTVLSFTEFLNLTQSYDLLCRISKLHICLIFKHLKISSALLFCKVYIKIFIMTALYC